MSSTIGHFRYNHDFDGKPVIIDVDNDHHGDELVSKINKIKSVASAYEEGWGALPSPNPHSGLDVLFTVRC